MTVIAVSAEIGKILLVGIGIGLRNLVVFHIHWFWISPVAGGNSRGSHESHHAIFEDIFHWFYLVFVTLPALAGIDIADCDRGV